ncbi:MAG TPA: signal peptidase II [Clostridiaceae bacterium]|nr:signal peptidase II [Clostridiaceae bacterium]
MAYTVAALIVLFDQITKALVEANIALGSQRPLIDGFAYLVHAQNTGAAWSLFAGLTWSRFLLAAISLAAAWLIAAAMSRSRHRTGTVLLGLILGGSVGNLIDRIRFGYVTDYLQLIFGNYRFPAFNVADAAITCGAILIVVYSLADKKFLDRLLPWLETKAPPADDAGLNRRIRKQLEDADLPADGENRS